MAIKEHVRLHTLYTSQSVRIVRLSVFVILVAFVLYQSSRGELPKLPLFFLSLSIMWEVFFHFSLSRIRHGSNVLENTSGDPRLSFSHAAIDSYYASTSSESLIARLLHFPQIQFILDRLRIQEKDVVLHAVSLDELAAHAFSLTQKVSGRLVTTMDLFCAYLLITENETKLLFANDIKTEDVSDVLVWARIDNPHEDEMPSQHGYLGDGFAEPLVDGWTPETEKYTTPFIDTAYNEGIGMIGRQDEYETLKTTLTKSENRNAVLVGAAGIGKEKLIATFAQDSHNGRLSKGLNHKKIITLLVGPLLAGTTDRAELESRLQTVIAELRHAGNIILFIPELQEILGESSFDVDLGGALLPYLKDGSLPVIATMTPEQYKKFLEKSGLHEVFTVITLPEPDEEAVKRILFLKVLALEKHVPVIIPINTVNTILLLSKKYLPDDVWPGNAVRLLDQGIQTAGSDRELHHRRIISPEMIIHLVEATVHAPLAAPQKEEKTLLLHLEEKLHERVIGQDDAIKSISEAVRRVRSGVTDHKKPVSFLFLGPTGVGKTETAKALADVYFKGEGNMLRFDMSEYVDESGVRRLLGAPGGERGELTEKIHDNPYTLVLLDEFEKAHPSILDLFLQVLSDGRLTDSSGRTVSFADAILIATSNAGSETIREAIAQGTTLNKAFHTSLLNELETRHVFKPELLNRFDGIITFTPLTTEELKKIVRLLLDQIVHKMTEKDITLQFDEQVIDVICHEGYDEQFGARPLKRYIQDTIEDMLARLLLEEHITRGDTVRFIVGADGKITTQQSGAQTP